MRRTYKNKERNKIRRIAKLKKANKSNIFRKHIKDYSILWNKLKMSQRISFIVIAVAVIAGVVIFFNISISSSLVPVISVPIEDKAALERIILRISRENVIVKVTANGIIQVADETTARRIRAVLISENLIPIGIDPWGIFDRERWTITDFERNVNFRRAQIRMITDHIMAIDDVDNANVNIVWPERELFASDLKPITAGVIITPKPGSDITRNRRKIEGIQRLLKYAIEGLQDENIVITDQNGLILNDFIYMAELDQLMLIEREVKFIQNQEEKYRTMLLLLLQQIFSPERVRDLHIKIDMDLFNPTQEVRNLNTNRITVSVNIDGTWKWKYGKNGNPIVLLDGSIDREYTPVPEGDLRRTEALIRDAIGYNSARGDSVTVFNIPFDRTKEFGDEDAAYLRQKQMQMTVIIILSGLTLLLVSFIIFRGIAGHAEVTVTKIP